MTASTLGLAFAVINIVALVALTGIGVFGLVRTSGKARTFVVGGVGVLVLARVLTGVLPMLAGAAGRQSFFAVQLTSGIVTNILHVVGVLLLVLGAIAAARHQAESWGNGPQGYAPPHGYAGPGAQGYPGPDAYGYPGAQAPGGQGNPAPPSGGWQSQS